MSKKLIEIKPRVEKQLDLLKEEYAKNNDDALTYSNAIKILLEETGRWPKNKRGKQ